MVGKWYHGKVVLVTVLKVLTGPPAREITHTLCFVNSLVGFEICGGYLCFVALGTKSQSVSFNMIWKAVEQNYNLSASM